MCSNLNNKDNEQKMIIQYQKNKNDEVVWYFYDKLNIEIANIVFAKISRKFSSIPLEKDDLTSIIWKGIKQSLVEYKIDKNYSFVSACIKKTYYYTIREAIKFLKNGEKILNIASSWDELKQNNNNYSKVKNGLAYAHYPWKAVVHDFIKIVNLESKKYNSNHIKQIIYLKSIGCSGREICKKLNFKKRYYDSLIKHIINIARKYY